MVIAYHIVFTTYGTWLPNDPRGSFSDKIYNSDLSMIAPIKYGKQQESPQHNELRKFWLEASKTLKRKPFFIDENARIKIVQAFYKTINGYKLIVPACAIMNDHVHILILNSKYKIGFIVNQLKSTATKNLNLKETPWTEGYWKVFINNEKTLKSAIDYIQSNPIKAGMLEQNLSFVRQEELKSSL